MSAAEPSARAQVGREARVRVPAALQARFDSAGRESPVKVLLDQAPSRLPELIPLRHTRMLASPFAFYRGAAAIMAGDLARTPVSGLDVQLCGDAHLSNFGVFASPERSLVFDLNDFDETFPGPWEWDMKRLVASLVVAGRGNGFSEKQTQKVTNATVRRYSAAMADFAGMGNLALWYERVEVARVGELFGDVDARTRKRVDKAASKARHRDHLHSLRKMTTVVDGQRRIVADPPVVVPVSELAAGMPRHEIETIVSGVLLGYAATLDPSHRALVDSYTFVDMARKAVGVGSVGTRCWIVLMRGRNEDDPLFLQVKEAQQSVLAPHLGATTPVNQGERVVVGQRLMQATGDVFLGWHRNTGVDGLERDFYVRQLRDWKGSADVESMSPQDLRQYGELCAWTLARAHARTGDRIALAAYLGDGVEVADAITQFAHDYADQNQQDYEAFAAAAEAGLVETALGSS